jgi:hypothetical protein
MTPPPAAERILLEGMADAWFFPPGVSFSSQKMPGKFQLSSSAVRFVPSRLLSAGEFGKKDTVEIQISAIESAQKVKALFPTIEIRATSGHVLKLAGYGKLHRVYEMLCQAIGSPGEA